MRLFRSTYRPIRQAGPTPFSTEWVLAPPPPERPRRVPLHRSWLPVRLPSWVPSERWFRAIIVLLLVSISIGGPAGQQQDPRSDPNEQIAAPLTDAALAPAVTESVVTATAVPAQGQSQTATTPAAMADAGLGLAGAPLAVATPEPAVAARREAPADAVLPDHRVLTYYGFPGDETMGILGEYDKEDVLALLLEQAAAYERVDPSRPVIVAFEVVASVAQPEPQFDGSFLLDAAPALLDEYAEFTAANDILLILDVQIGRRTVEEELEGLRPWLELPQVHVALDPEFAMAEGEIPGEYFGSITADDVRFAQDWLVDLAAEVDVPPKMLIVHQFIETMIVDKEQIAPVPGVQLVIDADGWGIPETKEITYEAFITNEPIEYHGVKLFYQLDQPLMTPEDILALDPPPDLIIYQ